MAGKFASLIVVASVFITGFVGYLANADVETDEREVYDYSANLVPSVLSSDVKQYEVYNPAGNVTGWYNDPVSNSVVQTTSTVSPYTLTSRIIDYTPYTIDVRPDVYFTDPNYSDWVLPDSSTWLDGEVSVKTTTLDDDGYLEGYVYFHYDPTASERLKAYLVSEEEDVDSVIEGGYFTGGRTMTKHYQTSGSGTRSDFVLDVKVTNPVGAVLAQSTASTPLYVLPLDVVSGYQNYLFHSGDVLDMSGLAVYTANADEIGWNLVGGRESNVRANFHYTWGIRNAYEVYLYQDDVGFVYNEDVQGWFRARMVNGFWYQDSTDTAMYTLDKLAIVTSTSEWGFDDPVDAINWQTATVVPATYADNTKMVDIGTRASPPFATEGIWSNGNSNGSITFLAKLTSSTGNLYIETYDGQSNLNGSFLATPDDVVSSTGYVQITLDVRTNQATISPVDNFENTISYSTSGYTKPLAVGQSFNGTDIVTLKLRFDNTGEAYIESTVVQLDPNGLLWSNPSMYLQYYYPDAFNGINTMKMPRVWFNAFVSLGTSVTINGVDYSVSEGTIDVQGTTVTLKGMAVDWRNDNGTIHVYIVPNGDSEKSIDVGPVNTTEQTAHIKAGGTYRDEPTTVGYNIKAEGVWYFEFGLYNGHTEEYDKVNLNITKGWGLSMQGACLMFAGSVILCTAVVGYYGRDRDEYGMEFMDWVIIILVLVVTIAVGGMI